MPGYKEIIAPKVRRPVVVSVRAFDAATDAHEREVIKDLGIHDNREWLTKFVLWAICNGKSVEIVNVKDDKDV